MNAAEYSASLAETFARILPRYFRRAERLGISTTGGIDSRMILAGAPREGQQICYTFGSAYRDSRDVVLAKQVARISQRPHETLRVGEDFLRQFPYLCEKAIYVSDGAMDASGAIDLYINRLARGIAPIRLTGNYGSEILRGHIAFRPVSRHDELFDPAFRRLLRTAEETYAHESQGRRISFIAFKQLPWHHYPRLALEQSQLIPRSPYLDNELVALAYRAPAGLVATDQLLLAIVAQANPQLATIPTDRGIVSRSVSPTTYARRLLHELTFKAEHRYDYGMPQWLAALDHALAHLHLETRFLGRHKFHHFRVWYRDQLRAYVRDVLLDPQTRGRPYFRHGALEDMVTRHIRGDRNYTLEIHRALTYELVQRQLIDQP
jgi:asparagine synthase (glutamine-hydrolysing)